MLPYASLRLAMLAVRVFPHVLPATNPSSEPGQCPARWTAPDTLRLSDGRPVFLDRPAATVPAREHFLLLSPLVVLGPEPVRSAPPRQAVTVIGADSLLGAVVASGGEVTLLRRPAFMRESSPISTIWAFPQSTGGYHVIWGGPIDTLHRGPYVVGSVWYSRFEGEQWSPPELVLKAPRIDWWQLVSSVAASGDEILVAAPAVDGAWRGVQTALRANGRWVTARFSGLPPVSPEAVAVAVAGRTWMAFYQDLERQQGALSPAMMARSLSQDGGSWGPPRRISALSPGATNFPLAIPGALGRVHLFWTFTPDGGGAEQLHHAGVTAAGTAIHDYVALPSPVDALTALRDGPQAVHLLIRASGSGKGAEVRWDGQRFGRIIPIPDLTSVGTGPMLMALRTGELRAIWTGLSVPTSELERPVVPSTVMARRLANCR